MKAIDTNILLRYLLDDDAEQSQLAASIITKGPKILVTDVVLAETIWTLVGKKYRLKKSDVEKVIGSLFEEQCIIFEDAQVVWRAHNDFRKSKRYKGKEIGFPEALIVNKSRAIIEKMGANFEGFLTFDFAAQQLDGAENPYN